MNTVSSARKDAYACQIGGDASAQPVEIRGTYICCSETGRQPKVAIRVYPPPKDGLVRRYSDETKSAKHSDELKYNDCLAALFCLASDLLSSLSLSEMGSPA